MANRSTGTDLTEGSIIKHLINFSVPLLLGNVFRHYTIPLIVFG